MLDQEVFKEMIQMLADTHQWKQISDVALEGMYRQLNKYGVEDKGFGDHCLKMMGVQFFKPASLVEHFQSEYVRNHQQKALPASPVKQDIQSDEFIRFVRMNRELGVALAQGKSYPTDRAEFKQLWQRPLVDDDYAYAESRKEDLAKGVGVATLGRAL